MIQKAVNIKAKANLRSNIIVQNLDICYSRDHCLSNNTTLKVKTKETNIKEFCSKNAKTKDPKLALLYTNMAELLE